MLAFPRIYLFNFFLSHTKPAPPEPTSIHVAGSGIPGGVPPCPGGCPPSPGGYPPCPGGVPPCPGGVPGGCALAISFELRGKDIGASSKQKAKANPMTVFSFDLSIVQAFVARVCKRKVEVSIPPF